MNTLPELDRCVLDAVSDDFEAPHTIASELSRDLARVVTEQEAFSSLVRLAKSGLVQAFRYDADTNRFSPVRANDIAMTPEPWFMTVDRVVA